MNKAPVALMPCGVGLLAAVVALALLSATAASGQEPGPARSLELEGWGLPEDGLQLGLFHSGEERELRYGGTLALVVRVRNTSGKTVQITCAGPGDGCIISALANNRLRFELMPREEVQALRLEPGEEQPMPGRERYVRFEPPGDRDPNGPNAFMGPESSGLLPGTYTVEFPTPIWLADPVDPSRHTAHRAHPGVARFTLLDDPADPWRVGRIVYDAAGSPRLRRETPGQPGVGVEEVAAPEELVYPPLPPPESGPRLVRSPVAWGELVNGLQGGLRLEGTPSVDLLEGLVPEHPGQFTFGLYIRNCTNRPLRIASRDSGDGDWSPFVEDSEGKWVPVSQVMRTGLRPLEKHSLAPGQCLRLTGLQLLLRSGPAPTKFEGTVPMAAVAPGRFTVSYCESIKWAADRRLSMAVLTGKATLEVTAGDLVR